MFLAMTLLAIPLALLRLVDADPSVYVAVVIMFAGYTFWRLVVAWGAACSARPFAAACGNTRRNLRRTTNGNGVR